MTEEITAQIDEAKAWEELREIQKEQHEGKWIFSGPEGPEKDKHEDFVRSRVNRGIELTAVLRGYISSPVRKPKASTGKKSAASLAAAITEDLLS